MSLPDRKKSLLKMPEELEVLPRPELKAIKAVELYTKWRPLLPSWARDITCPKPSDDAIKKIRLSKSTKTKERTEKRKLKELENI